ncbi:MAG TPA: hypothetical protein VE760_02695 [Acidimicrobiales bacterium]|nr:hypothetical protein [Acidimicrobiales bacterium]
MADLALLVAVALALRAPALTTLGLYRDDAWPALAARTDLGRALRLGITVPGFELAVRLWMGVSRATLWAQAPVLAASVATVVATYLLLRRVGCGRTAALVAGAILALSPVHVLYATRLKQYSFDALLALAVIAAALWLWRRPWSRGRWGLLLGVCTAAGLFSASTVPVGVVAMGASAWRGLRGPAVPPSGSDAEPARRLAVVAPAVYALVMAAYAAAVLGSVPPRLHALWEPGFVDASGPGRLVSTTWDVASAFAAGLFYRRGPVGPLFLAAAVAGAVAYRRDLAVLAVGPLAVAFALAVARRAPFGGGRTDVYLYPGVALAVAMAFQKLIDTGWLPRGERLVHGAVAVGVVAFAVTGGRAHVRHNPYPGVDMAGLQAAVARQHEPGDGVVVTPFSRYPWALYGDSRPIVDLSSRFTTGFTVRDRSPDTLIVEAEYVEEGYDPGVVVPFAERHRRVWYVATDSPVSDTPAEAQVHEGDAERVLLARGWRLERRIAVDGGHAHLLLPPGTRSS